MDKEKRCQAPIRVQIRSLPTPDAVSRIDRAINILLAAAEEYAKLSKEIANPEEDPPYQTHADNVSRNEGRATDENRVKKGQHD
jgi:hypothetical protein